MHNITPQLVSQYTLLWELVHAVNFNESTQTEDSITWTRTSTGEYTTKSAYLMQFEGSIVSPFPAMIWKIWVSSRCKFFLWLLLQDRVWTSNRLQLRGWPNQYFCQLCHHNLETAHHLFAECLVSREIWSMIGGWTEWLQSIPIYWKPYETMAGWYSGLTGGNRGTKEKGARSLAILVCWTIWHERNARVFDDKEKAVSRLVSEIKDEAALWTQAGEKHLATLVSLNISE
jgi:hypothetical protein